MRPARIFAVYCAAAALALLFILLTVARRPPAALQTELFSQRAHWVVTFWQTHGYFASGGLIALPPVTAGRSLGNAPFYFYRSSTGAWFLHALILENLAQIVEGRYDWLLLARVNLLIAAFTAALLAFLCHRVAVRLGLRELHAFCLGLAVLAVHFTFPGVLFFFWEMSTEGLAMPFFLAFLLLEHRVLRALAVFAMVYADFLVAVPFLAAYVVVCLILDDGSRVKAVLKLIVAPAAAAFLIFGIQLLIAHTRYPSIPIVGSSFMTRSGLDGDATAYRTHWDIIYGRDVARANFKHNREQLFRWPVLFVAGVLSLAALVWFYIRRRVPPDAFIAVATLAGTYAIYAGVFSQSVAVHPYNFDYLLVTPLIVAVFALVPAIAESLTERTGVFVLLAVFAAIWYTMAQLRDYALWYPMS